jgi:hypothetical protein
MLFQGRSLVSSSLMFGAGLCGSTPEDMVDVAVSASNRSRVRNIKTRIKASVRIRLLDSAHTERGMSALLQAESSRVVYSTL